MRPARPALPGSIVDQALIIERVIIAKVVRQYPGSPKRLNHAILQRVAHAAARAMIPIDLEAPQPFLLHCGTRVVHRAKAPPALYNSVPFGSVILAPQSQETRGALSEHGQF